MPLFGGAGGDLGAAGDYLFGDIRAAFREAGAWGLMRVLGNTQPDLLPLPKTGMVALANQPATTQAYANQPLPFTYTVTNPGTDPLHSVTVTDNQCSPVSFTGGDANTNSVLEPGEAWTYACTMTPTGDVANIARVSALDSSGTEVVLAKTATVNVINPQIAVIVIPSANAVGAGSTVTYNYHLASSLGDDPLQQVTLSDSACAPVTFTGGDTNNNGKLDLVELWNYTCTAVITADSSDSATGAARDSFGNPVASSGNAFVNALVPALEVSAVPSAANVNVGNSVVYNYTVKNAGETTLTNVALNDSRLGVVSLSAVTLAPGATTAGVKIYGVTEADLPGPLASTATATGVSAIAPFTPLTTTAGLTVGVTANPVLSLNRERHACAGAPWPGGDLYLHAEKRGRCHPRQPRLD